MEEPLPIAPTPLSPLVLSISLTLASGSAYCGGASRSAISKCAVKTCWLVGGWAATTVALEREDAAGEVGRGCCAARVWRQALGENQLASIVSDEMNIRTLFLLREGVGTRRFQMC